MNGPDEMRGLALWKRLRSRPLNLDPTVRMLPARFDLDRYNAFNKGTCVDPDAVDHGLLDRRSIFHRTPDPTPYVSPRHLHLKNCVGLSPTW